MMNENLEQKHHDEGVTVKVSYPNSMAKESFKFPWGGSIAALWDQAYEELKEGRKPEDTLHNEEGDSLMEFLGLTLRELHDRHLCPGFNFIIKSETGGADKWTEHNVDKGHNEVEVKVSYPNSMAKESFKFPWDGSITALWDQAYVELKEGRKPEDILLNAEGDSLTDYLSLTLRELHNKHLCLGFQFVIKSETGGAMQYEVPVLNDPSKAALAFKEHLQEFLAFHGYKSLEEMNMWKEDELTLFVPLIATGNSRNDDYLLRLHFGYYPKFPPSAKFVNPETKEFNPNTDLKWLPRIEGSNEIAVHSNYNGYGQLVCNSMTAEFYLVQHSYNKESHLWKPGMTFEATLLPIKSNLKSQYYKGRQG